jgi:TRAP-type C4-dicarboxylate transport system substrate-binding protein
MKQNKKSSRKFLTVLCIISAFVFFFVFSGYQSASAQTAKAIELKIGNQDPPVHFSHRILEAWAKKVEEETKGQVHFTIFPGGQLASGPEVYNAVLKGVMDVGRFAEGFTPARFPLNIGSVISVTGAPTGEVATRVRLDLYNKFPQLRDEFKDAHVLFMYATPAVNLHSRFPARTLKDFKGKQLRVPPAQVAWAKALAASPVTSTMDETYLALNKGIVDGFLGSDETLKSFRLAEVTKYTTTLNLFASPFAVVMNKKVWDSLPPDVQKVIDGLFEWASIEMAKGCDAAGKEGDDFAKTLKHEFITPTPQALDEIYTQVRPLNEAWARDMDAKSMPGTKIIIEINQSLKKYAAKAAVKPAAPAKTKTTK